MPGLPFEVVRRPTGGRAVLHGEEFEWSFAVAFPPGVPGGGPRAAVDVGGPYGLVAAAFAGALEELGVTLDGSGETPYQRSALCFAGALRYDLCARGEKIVAIAQAKKAGTDARPRVRAHAAPAGRARPRGRGPARRAVAGRGSGGRRRGRCAPETIWNATLRASRGRPAPGGGRDEEVRMTKILVLGGGPAGYVAAGRAAQLGAEVTLVEAREIGGTCLNRGCIPTKAMVAGAARLHEARRAAEYGVLDRRGRPRLRRLHGAQGRRHDAAA